MSKKRKEPDISKEEKIILLALERENGDRLPGCLGVLEELQEEFEGTTKVIVYWFLPEHWCEDQETAEKGDRVAFNLSASKDRKSYIPKHSLHRVQPERLQTLTAFVKEQKERLFREYWKKQETYGVWGDYSPFLIKESLVCRYYTEMKWEVKEPQQEQAIIRPIKNIYFNLVERGVYLLLGGQTPS